MSRAIGIPSDILLFLLFFVFFIFIFVRVLMNHEVMITPSTQRPALLLPPRLGLYRIFLDSLHIILLDMRIKMVATIPATSNIKTIQKAQHNHVRCRSFFFCRTSHESLWEASAVMVVTNLKREEGRPVSDRERVEMFGARKKGREGELGNEGLRCILGVMGGGGCSGLHGLEDGGGGGELGPRGLGRRRGVVDEDLCRCLVFCSWDADVGVGAAGCAFVAVSGAAMTVSGKMGDSGVESSDKRSKGSWLMGEYPGDDGWFVMCAVGGPRGECVVVIVVVVVREEREEVLVTYECLGPWADMSCFSISS